MRAYSVVDGSFWGSATIRSLSQDGRMAALYLLTCEHGVLTGTFRLPDEYAACDLQWNVERVREAFGELQDAGFIKRCPVTAWTWIRNFLKFNAPANPNQVKAARRLAASIPDACSWKTDFLAKWGALLGIKFDAPQDTVSRPLPNGSETVSKPFGNGSTTVSKPDSDSDSGTDSEQVTALSGNPSDLPDASSSSENLEKQKKRKSADTELHRQAIQVLDRLNDMSGKHFRPVPANLNLIEARLRGGATVLECIQVLANRCNEWQGDEKMEKYLRPKTIFNRVNFENYAGEIPARAEQAEEQRPVQDNVVDLASARPGGSA